MGFPFKLLIGCLRYFYDSSRVVTVKVKYCTITNGLNLMGGGELIAQVL